MTMTMDDDDVDDEDGVVAATLAATCVLEPPAERISLREPTASTT